MKNGKAIQARQRGKKILAFLCSHCHLSPSRALCSS
uniref:Uncharacterized protein n=1 Tax=Anguilla anguilla TaxID=7936 RepID=A0A0E9WAR2_ANGAN